MSSPTSNIPDDGLIAPEGAPPPDYSRLGFRELRALCSKRGIPADGTAAALVDKLRQWDAQHGQEVDTTVPDEPDLLDDEDDEPPQPADTAIQHVTPRETSTGGGEAASAPPPEDTPDIQGVPPAAAPQGDLPSIGRAPEVGDSPAYPAAQLRAGRPNMDAPSGVVSLGEGRNAQHGKVDVRAYRAEYVIGQREITDQDHFQYLERTHEAARADGYETKGGVTIGERVGYGSRNGQRTAIYQVPLRRQ